MSAADGVPVYWCMACPETFTTAEASNAHHDATGHNQTWRPSNGYAERQRRKAEKSSEVPS